MFKNYFKIALRNLTRHKGYAAINIGGLAVGIAACLLVFLVVNYELSYDKFQANYKRIYRVVTQDKFSDGITYNPGIPVPALDALRLKMPNVLFAGIHAIYGSQVTVNTSNNLSENKKFIEERGLFFCEPAFFNVFNFTWLQGNARVLDEPNIVVLSKKTAEKYFGDWHQSINKFIKLNNKVLLKVSGILQDVPSNSDFPLGAVISMKTVKKNASDYYYFDSWNSTSSSFQVYTLLPENVLADNINKQLVAFNKEHYTANGNSEKSNFLQPLSKMHFDNRFEIFGNHVTSTSTLWTLSIIGIFIIIMACINFINLSTAQAVGRSKEVGIRKVLGSNRKQLFFQVMGETGLVVCIAGILAICVASLCLPYIKHIASIEETLSLLNARTVAFVLLIILTVTLFSGLYPSVMLSGYNPALALKNKITSAKVAGISLRRGLVVTQFAISQVLVIGTIVAVSQMNFVNRADLGFNKEAVLILSGNSDSVVVAKRQAFKEKLLQIPGIQSVNFSSDAPSSDNNWSTNFAFDHKEDEKFQISLKFADEDYFKTYGIQILAGRVYDKSDTTKEVIINETLVQKLNVKNARDVIGKDIRIGDNWKKIVGVVKDFKTSSLRENIKPLLIAESKDNYSLTSVKIRSSNIPQMQTSIQSVWN
ncbi:MAG: ABC transporter permease, partial [Ferruginibacter sp.]